MIGKPFFHPPRNELQDPNMTANPFSICKMNACRFALLSAHFCIECFTQRINLAGNGEIVSWRVRGRFSPALLGRGPCWLLHPKQSNNPLLLNCV